MNAARQTAPARRWYAPDYRRQLRDAGTFRTLSASAQVVLGALCDRANAAGVAWPAVETIARDYGLAESTVRRVLGELAAAGVVLVARRAGRVSRYVLTQAKVAVALDDTPLKFVGGPSQIETPPLSNPAPIITMDHKKDHKQQHDSAEGAEVVVLEVGLDERGRHVEELEPGAIALLSPDVVERARALELSPAKLNRYGSDRVRWVLDALDAERTRKVIGNPGGWVMQALREHWTLPSAVIQHRLPFAAVAAEAARPPEGTRWGRQCGTVTAFEVVDVNADRVKLADGSVVPSSHWAGWEWLTEPQDGEDTQDGPFNDAVLAPDKRLVLARVSTWAALRTRTAMELEAKLEELGLTVADWQAYRLPEA